MQNFDETKDINTWENIQYSWIRKHVYVLLPNKIDRFSAILSNTNCIIFFTEKEKKIF